MPSLESFPYDEALQLQLKSSYDNYFDIVAGKVVCICAGAPFKDQNLVNAADVVVKTNKHFTTDGPIPTNVIYWNNTRLTGQLKNTLLHLRETDELKFIWINIPSDEWKEMAEFCLRHTIPWSFWGVDEVMRQDPRFAALIWPTPLMKKWRITPLTGISATYHLLSLGVKELLITGMDFYASATGNGMPPQWIALHEVLPQIKYLKEAWKEDERIILDEVLAEVVDRYNEFCGEIDKMGIIPSPAKGEVTFPGERIEVWTEGKVLKTLLEFKVANEEFYGKIKQMIAAIDSGEIELRAEEAPVAG